MTQMGKDGKTPKAVEMQNINPIGREEGEEGREKCVDTMQWASVERG